MNKVEMMREIARLLRLLAETLDELGEVLVGIEQEKNQESRMQNETLPKITLEQVRGVLAEKSRAGFTADVKELIGKYGAERLSDVEPASYPSLLKDAEVLGNE